MYKKRFEVKHLSVDQRSVLIRLVNPKDSSSIAYPLQYPIILLHGLGCSSEAWLPSLLQFQKKNIGQTVYAADFPGCGHSQNPSHVLNINELADWVIALMDNLQIETAYIGGNSMGGQVALALALRYPQRIGGLSLIGPTVGGMGESFGRYAWGLLRDGFSESLKYNLLLTKMYMQTGFFRYCSTVKKLLNDDPLTTAGEIKAPSLILRGGNDRIILENVARNLAQLLPNGHYQALDSTAHAAEYNTPELYVDATLRFFLERVQGLTINDILSDNERLPGSQVIS